MVAYNWIKKCFRKIERRRHLRRLAVSIYSIYSDSGHETCHRSTKTSKARLTTQNTMGIGGRRHPDWQTYIVGDSRASVELSAAYCSFSQLRTQPINRAIRVYMPSLDSQVPSNLTRRLSLNLEYNICETRKILELSADCSMIGILEVLWQ